MISPCFVVFGYIFFSLKGWRCPCYATAAVSVFNVPICSKLLIGLF